MAITVEALSQPTLAVWQDRLIAVYRDAFQAPPYHKSEAEVEEFASWLPVHWGRQAFRLVVATDQATGQVVGFTYGYAERPGQGFYDETVKVMPPDMAKVWLANSFRIVEMAVAPPTQRQGIGGGLHDRLLRDLPYSLALLATMAADTPASRMYLGRGWTILLDHVAFPGAARLYRVMGLDLEQWAGQTGKNNHNAAI